MKKKNKYNLTLLAIAGVSFGRIFSRYLSSYFGNDGTAIAMEVVVVILLGIIIISFAMGYYKGAITVLTMTIPLIISGIGMYFKNIILMVVGLALFFILPTILIKFMPKWKRDR